MPGYYPPVPMAQMYPPVRSYSMAKLNQGPARDYSQFEKVRVEKQHVSGDRRKHRLFEGLRRQQSYEGEAGFSRFLNQPNRNERFNSLQLLGANDDGRYLDHFMETQRGRTMTREPVEQPKGKDRAKTNKLLNSATNSLNSKNKENKISVTANGEILALIGTLTGAASVDNIYESVEQIHYRKTLETLDREEKVRSIHRTGHPLFDSLREERALAGGNDNDTYATLNSSHKRVSRSAAPGRKTSCTSSPVYSSTSSSDELDLTLQRNRRISVPITQKPKIAALQQQQAQQHRAQQHPQRPRAPQPQQTQMPRYRKQQVNALSPNSSPVRWGSAGSESDEEWIIPRPKFYNRKREVRGSSTDESDSSTKSSPIR
ncbi:uncharacterized protein LOC108674996 [Hyalella azteca]|uniref:Uncharacterized protein LOC108674996 n=1 Tax=Hyalella azteca TaxID=294128 RepID=A0A8B7NXP7_HYAAZ|nr:uncharacterized protein LOC108674996 [Hyalella azteca]